MGSTVISTVVSTGATVGSTVRRSSSRRGAAGSGRVRGRRLGRLGRLSIASGVAAAVAVGAAATPAQAVSLTTYYGIPAAALTWDETVKSRDVSYAMVICGIIAKKAWAVGAVACAASAVNVAGAAKTAASQGKCTKLLLTPVGITGGIPYSCGKHAPIAR